MTAETVRREGPPAHVHEVLARHEEAFEEAAESTDDAAHADVFKGLAAQARGEPVPEDIRRRVTERGGPD